MERARRLDVYSCARAAAHKHGGTGAAVHLPAASPPDAARFSSTARVSSQLVRKRSTRGTGTPLTRARRRPRPSRRTSRRTRRRCASASSPWRAQRASAQRSIAASRLVTSLRRLQLTKNEAPSRCPSRRTSTRRSRTASCASRRGWTRRGRLRGRRAGAAAHPLCFRKKKKKKRCGRRRGCCAARVRAQSVPKMFLPSRASHRSLVSPRAAGGSVQRPRTEVLAALQARTCGQPIFSSVRDRLRDGEQRCASAALRRLSAATLTPLVTSIPCPRSLFYDVCWPTPQYYSHFRTHIDVEMAPEAILETARESFQDALSVAGGLLKMPADKMPGAVRSQLQAAQKVAMTNIIALTMVLKARGEKDPWVAFRLHLPTNLSSRPGLLSSSLCVCCAILSCPHLRFFLFCSWGWRM